MLTPPVRVIAYSDRCEVLWEPCRPFRYEFAPVIVDSNGYSDMPLLLDLIKDVRRNGWGGKFADSYEQLMVRRFRPVHHQFFDAIYVAIS